MAKEFKGFGKPPEKSKKNQSPKQSRSTPLEEFQETKNVEVIPKFDFEAQEKRIKVIVEDDGEVAEVSEKTLASYQKYLEENIERPCILTGQEDFPWEEKYVFGYGSDEEYEELKKKYASYTDTFELLGFEAKDKTYNIHVKVKRVSDKKKFVLALDYLEPVDKTHKNMELISDYTTWLVNWQ